MFGLGKPRSKFGKMIDKKGIAQVELAKESGVDRSVISRMCNDDNYRAKIETEVKIKRALKNLGG